MVAYHWALSFAGSLRKRRQKSFNATDRWNGTITMLDTNVASDAQIEQPDGPVQPSRAQCAHPESNISQSTSRSETAGKIEGIAEAKALRGSELRYKLLFEAGQDGILILDAITGLISDVNPFLIRLLDYSREELVGKALSGIRL